MLILINFILSICLCITIAIGFTRSFAKKLIKCIIYSRIFYLGIITCQVLINIKTITYHPLIIIINDILIIIYIALVEQNYLKKQQGTINKLDIILEFVFILIFILMQSKI